MMRWRLLLEDSNPAVKHIAGEKNLLEDALSWLEMRHKSHDVIDWEPPRKYYYHTATITIHTTTKWKYEGTAWITKRNATTKI